MGKKDKDKKSKANKERKIGKENRAQLVTRTADGSISERQMEVIEWLRDDLSDQLAEHATYDTDFNLLRWLTAYGFKYDEVHRRLSKHLRLRTLLRLNNISELDTSDDPIYRDYIPYGWLGDAGKNNQLAFVEMVGRYDPRGLINSVQPMPFMLARLKLLDDALLNINRIEATTGKASGIVYIYDLDGLEMDPGLLTIVTGPFRVFWIHISDNYPELINKLIIINAPGFISILYKAIAPFLPEHTREKVIFADSNWKETLKEYITPDRLPEFLGGTRRDKNDDPMCREFMHFPPATGKRIPKELYWKPPPGHPTYEDLISVHIPAGKYSVKSVQVDASDLIMHLYLFCDQEYTLSIYYDANNNNNNEKKAIESYQEYMPCMEQAPFAVIDHQQWPLENKGTYYFRFGNAKAWLKSVTVKVHFDVKHTDNTDANNLAHYHF